LIIWAYAIVYPNQQEIRRRLVNHYAMETHPEKKYRIHFPLNQISAPVVTHLVTDFDLSPNLLRADIDAKNGGWLVLGLSGDEARLESALAWLRGQGLDVTKEE